MKKRLAMVLAVTLLATTVFVGCGSKDNSSDKSSKKEYTEKKSGDKFTVGFDQDFPPMGFVGDDGEYTGFDLELAQEVCKRQGWKYVAKPIAWDSKDAELKSGGIDCIWNGFTMDGREDKYTWSKPYLNNEQVFVVRKSFWYQIRKRSGRKSRRRSDRFFCTGCVKRKGRSVFNFWQSGSCSRL